MKANKVLRPKQGQWPFMVQSRRPGEPSPWAPGITPGGHALDLEAGLFSWTEPLAIAQSLKDAADHSERRKSSAFQSAMSVLTLYINRAGSQLPPEQRAVLETAKDELRELYGRARHDEPHGVALPPGGVERRGAGALS